MPRRSRLSPPRVPRRHVQRGQPLRIFIASDPGMPGDDYQHHFVADSVAVAVGWAATTVEALHWLQTHISSWDVLVIDNDLAGLNTRALIDSFSRRRADQKIVVMAHAPWPELIAELKALGVDAVFRKDTSQAVIARFVYQSLRRD